MNVALLLEQHKGQSRRAPHTCHPSACAGPRAYGDTLRARLRLSRPLRCSSPIRQRPLRCPRPIRQRPLQHPRRCATTAARPRAQTFRSRACAHPHTMQRRQVSNPCRTAT
eukprot:3858457-Prymnesium_polylepis.1